MEVVVWELDVEVISVVGVVLLELVVEVIKVVGVVVLEVGVDAELDVCVVDVIEDEENVLLVADRIELLELSLWDSVVADLEVVP